MKQRPTVRIDLAAYILLTVASFWVLSLEAKIYAFVPLAQAIVVLIFCVAWWGLTYAMLFVQHRVRIVRRPKAAGPLESRSS